MISIVVELPGIRGAGEESARLDWLLARIQSEQSAIEIRICETDAIRVSIEDVEHVARAALSVPIAQDLSASAMHAGALEIAPGVALVPAPVPLDTFLRGHWLQYDHLGINFSHRALAEPTWLAFVDALAAWAPAWRLDVGSANDIVFVVLEDVDGAGAAVQPTVVELVYDRAAATSSAHFCVRVAAARAAVEHEFAAPRGGCKPGDEAFFRSVALPSAKALPLYVDLAFSDAQVAPWPQTVRAIGRRIG